MICFKNLCALVLFGGLMSLSGSGLPSAAMAESTGSEAGSQAGAQEAAQDVLLTLQLSADDASVQRLTLEDLRALGTESFETETIWTSGVQEFTGVSLARLAQEFDLTEGVLQARAVNDYMVEVPLSDAVDGGPIIAFERNGQPMSLRTKGPLWLVYPYDSKTEYRNEVIYSRSIWQLDRLTVASGAE